MTWLEPGDWQVWKGSDVEKRTKAEVVVDRMMTLDMNELAELAALVWSHPAGGAIIGILVAGGRDRSLDRAYGNADEFQPTKGDSTGSRPH